MALPNTEDTIAAIATPPGTGAIGVVRVSGPLSRAIVDRIFRPLNKSLPSQQEANTVILGTVHHDGETLDQALLLTFHSPRSYTGQDLIELQTHGGPAVLKGVLRACLNQGARPAGPGEFTLRAFLSGRMDLVQAESVLSLINAETEQARRQAVRGLAEELSTRINEIQTDLIVVYGAIQATLDYPEEGVPEAEKQAPLERAETALQGLLATARIGDITHRGARLALIGKPNAGKSSLLNALLGYERSIVSDQSGTTRDYLEAPLDFEGIPVTVIDTAGIRATKDPVEKAGVETALQIAATADLALLIMDQSEPFTSYEKELYENLLNASVLTVATKADLPPAWTSLPWVEEPLSISVKTGTGLDALRSTVSKTLLAEASTTELWITVDRHKVLLEEVLDLVCRAKDSPDDLAALDLEVALTRLGEITGRSEVSEETLTYIFSQFCVGK
jgi:tRNA modification GTPase